VSGFPVFLSLICAFAGVAHTQVPNGEKPANRPYAAIPEVDVRNAGSRDFNTRFELRPYASRDEWESRKGRLRRQILFAAGLSPLPAKTPLNIRVVRRIERRNYSIEVLLLETSPGYFLGANLYRPTRKNHLIPAVLLPHGHWKRGRLEDQPAYSVPALGVNLALQGYMALAYDMVGYNDSQQIPHSFGGPSEDLWSWNTLGIQLWNSIRALDYLQSLPEVDSRRIAATGGSGGATQAFLVAAIDDRVRVSAPVNMVSAYMQGGDPCEEAPNLRLGTSNVEIAAMMAPRPMLVVSSTRDWTRHTPAEEFPWIQRIYGLYGAAGEVENAHINAEHNYNRQSREAVYRFFAKQMRMNLSPGELVDQPFEPLPYADMLAFPDGSPPKGAPTFPQLFETWRAAARFQTEQADAGGIRQLMQEALGADWPNQIASALNGHRLLVSRGKGDRVEGQWIPGSGEPVLLVHADGAAAALREPLADQVQRAGRPLLAIDSFRSSPEQLQNYRARRYYLSYNQTEDAYRTQDIVTALAFLKQQQGGPVELACLGEAGVACLFAAAACPIDLDLLVDLNGFSGSDEDFRNRFFVPGIQRIGGLQAALRLLKHVRLAIPATPHSR
jgi:dienelactone hydrolase